MTTSASASSDATAPNAPDANADGPFVPPTAKREEERCVLAGLLPDDHPLKDKLIRQSETAKEKGEPLLDPARKVHDPYGWLRDEKRADEDVLNHLKAENAYTQQMTSHLESLRSDLYDEMLSAIQETDFSVPANKKNKFYYYSRTNQGESYKLYCRAPISNHDNDAADDAAAAAADNDATTPITLTPYTSPDIAWDGTISSPILPNEEVYLNVNTLAKDKPYCSASSIALSNSQNLLAYAVDFSGDEIYSLYVKDLTTDQIVDHDPSIQCYGRVVWGADEKTLFYIKMDDAQRPFQVYRRKLGQETGEESESKSDELLFEQLDDLFWTSAYKSSDEKYLFIETSSSETSEIHYLDLTDPTATLQCIAKKRTKVLYDIEHWNGHWIITSNVDETPNMRLMTCKVGQDESQWKDVTMIEDDDNVKLFDGGYEKSLSGVETFEKYLVCSGRFGGIPRVWVVDFDTQNTAELKIQKSTMLEFDETAYDVGVSVNYNYDSEKLVLYYDSLITPPQSLEVSMKDPNNVDVRKVLKQRNVPGYEKVEYGCDRLTVTSRDGNTEIPISMVYRKDVMEEFASSGETIPVHLVGYGSYGASSEADFTTTRLPLLKRGMVYIMAHIRGGGEMGRQWYEEPNGAKYLCKENTFNDFCDIAKWLTEEKKLTTPQQLSIEGRSAGGLLIGASINQAPELFGVAILGVPFVDVVATMIDSSIPLTCGEWEEWGNPNEEKYFEYMMRYSPMNNVKEGGKYPSCLLTGGLHDPRVQFWEPAKFAAELRHSQNSETSGPICLKIDMTAGHFSASDRYKYLRELAFDWAFLLDQLGLATKEKL